MRLVKRNLRPIWYQLYQGSQAATDDEGYETGEPVISYADPVQLMCNISPASGKAQTMMFGTDENYDKAIVTDRMDCPIDENTVLFVDREPVYEDGKLANTYDYIVKRVAKSLNHISYAITKVKVS